MRRRLHLAEFLVGVDLEIAGASSASSLLPPSKLFACRRRLSIAICRMAAPSATSFSSFSLASLRSTFSRSLISTD